MFLCSHSRSNERSLDHSGRSDKLVRCQPILRRCVWHSVSHRQWYAWSTSYGFNGGNFRIWSLDRNERHLWWECGRMGLWLSMVRIPRICLFCTFWIRPGFFIVKCLLSTDNQRRRVRCHQSPRRRSSRRALFSRTNPRTNCGINPWLLVWTSCLQDYVWCCRSRVRTRHVNLAGDYTSKYLKKCWEFGNVKCLKKLRFFERKMLEISISVYYLVHLLILIFHRNFWEPRVLELRD